MYARRAAKVGQDRVQLVSPSFVDYVQAKFVGDVGRTTNLTTGMVAIMLALHACESVSSYGFGGGVSVSPSGRSARSNIGMHVSSSSYYYLLYFTTLREADEEEVLLGTIIGVCTQTETPTCSTLSTPGKRRTHCIPAFIRLVF